MAKPLNLDKLQRNELALLLDRSVKTLENWTRRPEETRLPFHLSKTGVKYYIWKEAFEWFCREIVAKEAAPQVIEAPEDTTLTAARLRGQNLKNEAQALENAVRREELLEAATVERTWSEGLLVLRAALLGTVPRLASELRADMTQGDRRRVATDLLFGALQTAIRNIREEREEPLNEGSEELSDEGSDD